MRPNQLRTQWQANIAVQVLINQMTLPSEGAASHPSTIEQTQAWR